MYFIFIYAKSVQSDSDYVYVHFMATHFNTAGTEINLQKKNTAALAVYIPQWCLSF